MADLDDDPNRGGTSWREGIAAIIFGCVVVASLAVYSAFSSRDRRQGAASRGGFRSAATAVQSVVASEELILALTPRLGDLARSVVNRKLPDHYSSGLFENRVVATDLAGNQPRRMTEEFTAVATQVFAWRCGTQEHELSIEQLGLWQVMLADVAHFSHAKFHFIRGEYTDGSFEEFDAEMGFAGLARLSDGRWSGVKATQRVRWHRSPSDSSDKNSEWRISEWRQTEFETTESDQLLFADVLDEALPEEGERKRARISRHREILMQNYFGRVPAKLPKGYIDSRFFPDSNALHPGLSVVDIDGDGFDDLYLTVRWGKNQLLRNLGNGTFEEIAGEIGLDVEGRSTGAVFVDFDNDGDSDLMLGRSLERSMYLINEGGKFIDRSASMVSVPLPYLVTSISAADYNGDGLMDVYFSTYTPSKLNERIAGDRSESTQQAHKFLTSRQARHLEEISAKKHHPLLAQVGPPNVLLMNQGSGKFNLAAESEQLAVWRNTFQATWADYDEDGDPDLYVANDYAADQLFRNDRDGGFVDITGSSGADEMGFAMGASWGDYDNDGLQDLYVSNMYSKAGMRILAKFAEVDGRYSRMVEGNYLYRNTGGRLKLVSGLKPPALTVARAGWSWGGQFADLDNDGYLDIYVASGYYTVPDEFSTKIDL